MNTLYKTPFCDFEQGRIRPPDEANSLLIRTTRGCPWNKCHYCTLFKGERFSIRSVEEIQQDIRTARQFYEGVDVQTCFLQDGDSFAMKTKDLLAVLKTLKEEFPSLKRISSYGRAQTMLRKSEAEIKEIHNAGLNMLYCGIESGSDTVLKFVNKGVDAQRILQASLLAKKAGMQLIAFAILGLGGKEHSTEHISETANLLNAIKPDTIRLMSLAAKPDTKLGQAIENNEFSMLSEVEMIQEQHDLLSKMESYAGKFGTYHGVNLLNEAVGNLSTDRAKMLAILENFLSLGQDEQRNFILGKRLGYYSRLKDFKRTASYEAVGKLVEKIPANTHDEFFHELRQRLI